MKIKGVIKKLTFLRKKILVEKINLEFSGAVVGSVGSVQLQTVPCSSLYLFSRSMLLLLLVSRFSHVRLCATP